MINVPYILGQLSDRDADWLGSVGRKLRLRPGEVLIENGTRLKQLFIVLDGSFTVVSPMGTEVARVGLGDILGEMSLIDHSVTSASVIALSDALVLAVDSHLVEDRIALDSSFAARFYKSIAMFLTIRMRDTLARIGSGGLRQYPSVLRFDGHEMTPQADAERAGARFELMLRKLWGIAEDAPARHEERY